MKRIIDLKKITRPSIQQLKAYRSARESLLDQIEK